MPWDVLEARGPHMAEPKRGFFKAAAEFIEMVTME